MIVSVVDVFRKRRPKIIGKKHEKCIVEVAK
jgi:hypothetical protein